jgi:hypothetical protein
MADTKVTGLTEITNPALTDLVYVAADPGGTPASKKATLANIALALGFGALTDWTPVIMQGVTVASTTIYAKYCRIGPLMYICASVAIVGAGTSGAAVFVTGMPDNPAYIGGFGIGLVENAGTAFYAGEAECNTNGTIGFICHLEISAIGIDPNFALASGDGLYFFAVYPV